MFSGVAGLKRKLPTEDLSRDLEALVLMTPYDGASDSVATAARDLFERHVKNQPNVHDIFFKTDNAVDPYEVKITGESGFDYQGFAAAYVSAAIGQVALYKFGDAVDEQKCLDYMKERMNSDSWQKMGMPQSIICIRIYYCRLQHMPTCWLVYCTTSNDNLAILYSKFMSA